MKTRQEISTAIHGQTQVYGFTDGSSRSREKSPNSGIGIVIYGPDRNLLWEGGFGIRTDGNNYVAELAAATVLLSSIPEGTKLTLFTDCKSAIFTLGSPGTISERRKMRTPSRIWALKGRKIIQRREDVVLQHVRSHQGISTFEQKGNDRADQLAKQFLALTEEQGPLPFHTTGDIKLEFAFEGKIITEDIRRFLKKMEKKEMMEKWKNTERQGELARQFPSLILKQAKKVWQWAVELKDGAFGRSISCQLSNGYPPKPVN